MLNFSKMNLDDLKILSPILQSDFDDFWNENIFKSELENENSYYIVAKVNNDIVGFGGLWKSIDDIHITNIVTKKSLRNKGIGKAMMHGVILKCKELGVLKCYVNSYDWRKKFYNASGFITEDSIGYWHKRLKKKGN